jgi:CRP/FNR family transcriptional regulator
VVAEDDHALHLSMAVEFLRQLPMFRTLSDDELSALATRAQHRAARRGELLVTEDGHGIFVLEQGAAYIYRISTEGREIIVFTLQAGDAFHLALITPNVRLRCVLRAAVDDTVGYGISLNVLQQLMRSRPEMAIDGLNLIALRLASALDLVEDLVFNSLKVRLAHLLSRLAGTNQQHLVTETHEQLAAMIGASREEVTRALNDFRREELVDYPPHQHGIVVSNPARLTDY